MSLPNLISLARLLMVPLNIWLMVIGEWKPAFALFCTAGLSDAVDGFIARRFGAETRLGRYLDPVADKCLLVAVFVTLGLQDAVPVWLVILIVSRDLMIVGGVLLFYVLNHPFEERPLVSSKINTGVQIVLAALVMAGLAFEIPHIALYIEVLVIVAGVTAMVSGSAYLIDWIRRINVTDGIHERN
jgi:cardiolipin synthase